jgi:hypothetical protein
LDPVKSKIKEHYRGLLNDVCCYCRKTLKGEFNMVIDIEHILPKAHFKKFEFTSFNLSVACKRCNMKVKKQDTSFLVDAKLAHNAPLDKENYLIIHPNFENYADHLDYYVFIRNEKRIIKYTVLDSSKKGNYTYNYFRLNELEIDSANLIQGVKDEKKYSDLMDPVSEREIEDLIRDIYLS